MQGHIHWNTKKGLKYHPLGQIHFGNWQTLVNNLVSIELNGNNAVAILASGHGCFVL